ncbi:MAG: hypothetical protein ACKVOM_13340 [Ferruginibacter sp.]
MKKSNIVLAILAGAAIGGIIAIVLKAENALTDDDAEEDGDDNDDENNAFNKIARQFSDKISSELKAAENKIKSAVKIDNGFLKPDEETGVFL